MRTCKVCKGKFTPSRQMQGVCESYACMMVHAMNAAKKSRESREKKARAEARSRREALKTRRDYIKEAQSAFNAYIRARDKGKPCICCQRPLVDAGIGGGYDCGHYRSVGSAPHLRFDERNAHGQTKQCNRYGSGRAVDYRIGLIQRIGLAEVEALEADQAVRKWTVEELIQIKKTYKEKARLFT